MNSDKNKDAQGVFKSVMLAYTVLVLHVLLLALLVMLVIFFRGVLQYMIWIFLFGAGAIVFSGFMFYRRMKAEGKTLREMLRSPLLSGRAVEVSLLGGLATFKLGRPSGARELGSGPVVDLPRIEDPATARIRELKELARLLENDLITPEEYHQTKCQLFKP